MAAVPVDRPTSVVVAFGQIRKGLGRTFAGAFLLVPLSAQPDSPFSHKRHAPLKLSCAYCHAGKQERIGFPALATCATCHTGISDRKIPSTRVYRIADFVNFSHAVHTARVECATCHGEVATRDTLKEERPTTMVACVNCHKEHKATVACTPCHELGQ